MAKFEGGCACGAVRFSTDADPMMAGHCQCGKCQKLGGGGHASFAAFPADSLTVTGKVTFWDYIADSGNTASRGHCPTCGSHVFGKTTGMPTMIAVHLAALEDSSKIAPSMVVFSSKAQPWDHMDPSLPRFPGMPPM